MLDSDRDSFVEMLTGICSMYGHDLTEFLVKVWWGVLRAHDLPAIKRAVLRYVEHPDTGRFMPKPSDIVRILGGAAQDNAQLAWTKVAQAVGTVGGHESVVFDDRLIHAVLADMGGWVALCDRMTDDNSPFMQREFETRYRAAHLRGVQQFPRVLFGRIASSNGAKFAQYTPPPKLIGNTEAAMRVYQDGALEGGSRPLAIPLDEAVRRNERTPPPIALELDNLKEQPA